MCLKETVESAYLRAVIFLKPSWLGMCCTLKYTKDTSQGKVIFNPLLTLWANAVTKCRILQTTSLFLLKRFCTNIYEIHLDTLRNTLCSSQKLPQQVIFSWRTLTVKQTIRKSLLESQLLDSIHVWMYRTSAMGHFMVLKQTWSI